MKVKISEMKMSKYFNFAFYHEPPQEISKEALELLMPTINHNINTNIKVSWNPRLPTGDVMEWFTKPHKESEK